MNLSDQLAQVRRNQTEPREAKLVALLDLELAEWLWGYTKRADANKSLFRKHMDTYGNSITNITVTNHLFVGPTIPVFGKNNVLLSSWRPFAIPALLGFGRVEQPWPRTWCIDGLTVLVEVTF